MSQPLVCRPALGDTSPKATAQLPSGSPAGKGIPLDDGVGYKTFSKPEEDIREPHNEPGSIHRIDGPDSWAKEEDVPSVTDWTAQDGGTSPSYMGLGDKAHDSSKTTFPYRNDKSDTHNAAGIDPAFVAELHLLQHAPILRLRYQDCTAARVATTAEYILEGLNPKFVARSRQVAVTLKRADRKNLRWVFSAKGKKLYAVKIRAVRPRANTTKFSKMDLELSCSCPAWQWQGPEFHAKGPKDYQLGPLAGTASPPDIRDPERQNFVCKHMAAVLAATKAWDIPLK